MARIEFKGTGHSYRARPRGPADYALKPMSCTWADGRAYALLGPSGCGKTTLLNIISGLVRPSAGRVEFDGRDVTDLPTRSRNIAQVFQFPVIYNVMSVYENLAFPLRCRRLPAGEIEERVRSVAELLNLTAHLKRPARSLGADGKQLVSLGRGLVRSDVAAILMDEPLTVIDPHLKWLLRRKLKEINERHNLTLIYVTHDQNEALTFAEEVVVMRDGEIVQVGTPRELFERPRHTFVGYFIGSPSMNLLPCRAAEQGVWVGEVHVALPGGVAQDLPADCALELGVRPEFLELHAEAVPGAVEVAVRDVRDLGHFRIVSVAMAGHELKIKVPRARPIPAERGFLRFPPERTMLYRDG